MKKDLNPAKISGYGNKGVGVGQFEGAGQKEAATKGEAGSKSIGQFGFKRGWAKMLKSIL